MIPIGIVIPRELTSTNELLRNYYYYWSERKPTMMTKASKV
jgi:hypothetical protein